MEEGLNTHVVNRKFWPRQRARV